MVSDCKNELFVFLQITCKLYQFNAAKQKWDERGMGNLHLNDHKFTGVNGHFQSRLGKRMGWMNDVELFRHEPS